MRRPVGLHARLGVYPADAESVNLGWPGRPVTGLCAGCGEVR